MKTAQAPTYGLFAEGNQPSTYAHARTPREASHRPNSPWDAQRTQADMIRAMCPATFTSDSRDRHRDALQDAHAHMIHADTRRVMHMTGLTTPFPHSNS